MHGPVNNGFGKSPLITERLWATFASSAVRKVQLARDMTDQELADNIGCSAQTVANARNMKTNGQRMGQLEGRTFANLLAVDEFAFEGVLNHYGRRSVPITAKCDTDALPSLTGAVHRLAVAQSPNSPGGPAIRECELSAMLPDLEAAHEAISHLIARARKVA